MLCITGIKLDDNNGHLSAFSIGGTGVVEPEVQPCCSPKHSKTLCGSHPSSSETESNIFSIGAMANTDGWKILVTRI